MGQALWDPNPGQVDQGGSRVRHKDSASSWTHRLLLKTIVVHISTRENKLGALKSSVNFITMESETSHMEVSWGLHTLRDNSHDEHRR